MKIEWGWFRAFGLSIWLLLGIYNNLPDTAEGPADGGTQTVHTWSGKGPFEDGSAHLRQPCQKMQGQKFTINAWIMSPESVLNWFLSGVKPQNCRRKQQLSTVLIIFHQAAASPQSLWCGDILYRKYFLKITKSPWCILDFCSSDTIYVSRVVCVCTCVCVCYTSESFYRHIFPWC